jgi:hypothetical protein
LEKGWLAIQLRKVTKLRLAHEHPHYRRQRFNNLTVRVITCALRLYPSYIHHTSIAGPPGSSIVVLLQFATACLVCPRPVRRRRPPTNKHARPSLPPNPGCPTQGSLTPSRYRDLAPCKGCFAPSLADGLMLRATNRRRSKSPHHRNRPLTAIAQQCLPKSRTSSWS